MLNWASRVPLQMFSFTNYVNLLTTSSQFLLGLTLDAIWQGVPEFDCY